MLQLTGEYQCTIDEKGRVKLPSSLTKQLAEAGLELSFMINRGFEKCLMVYPKTVWDRKAAELSLLNIYDTKQRNFVRYFYRGATALTADNSERILLPKNLFEYAGIEKEIILFAFQEQIEIWAKNKYSEVLAEEPEEFSVLSEGLFSLLKKP